jgi:membrane associated rhomboid family serine protease
MVVVIVPLFLFFTTLVPALILIGLWFVIQLLSGLAAVGDAMGGAGGVAWFAHVGGFVTGLLLIFIFPKRQQRPTRLYEGWEE